MAFLLFYLSSLPDTFSIFPSPRAPSHPNGKGLLSFPYLKLLPLRPISLLNLISKLLGKHIFEILLDHLFSSNLLSNSQFGFLPCCSTVSALAAATQHILSTFDSGLSLCGVFLHIKKAFDSVSHSILLSKLQSLGILPHIFHWLSSYLPGRSQCVRVGSVISPPSPVSSGVPQGSILGPLLFVIIVNDLNLLPLSSNSKVFLYADDLLLLYTFSPQLDPSLLQSDLDIVTSWFSSNRLSVNPSKSKYMFSLRRQSSFDSLPHLLLSTVPFVRVYSFKYLGIILSCNLSWSSHINSVIKRAKRLVGLIYRQFYSLSSSQTLLSLYITIVRPILEYGSAIWDPPSVSVSSSDESVLYFALKMVQKSWSAPYANLLSFLNLSSLQHHRLQSKLVLFYKINNGFLHYVLVLHLCHSVTCPILISVSFCRTSTYYHSLLPSSIRLWNSLPSLVKKSQSISYVQFFLSCEL